MEMEEDAAVHQAQQSPSARADLEDEPVRESAAEPGAIPTTGEAATSAANLPLPSSASSHAQDLAHSLSDFHPVDSAASVPESGGDSRSFSPSFVHIDPGIAQQEVTHSDVMNDDEEEAAFEDEDYEMNGDRYESDEAGRDSGEVEEYSGEEGEDDDRETAGAVEVIDLLDSDEAEAEENAGEENSYSGENEVNGDETSRVESSGSLDDPDSTVTSEGVPDSHDTQITVPADSVDDRRSFSLRDAQSEEVLSIPADSGGPAGSEDSRFEMDVDGDQTANVEPGSGTRPRFNANILGPSDDANPPSSTSASPEAPGHGRTATRPTSPSRDLPTTAARDEDFVADVAITASILEAAATGDPSHTAAVTEDAAHSSSGSQNLPPTVTSSNNEVARLEAPAKPSATINASSSTPATPTPKMSKLDILRQKKMKLNSEYQRLPQPQPTIEQDRQLAAPTDQNTEEPPSREQPQSQRPPQPELLPRDDFTLRRVLDSLSLQKFDASFRGAMHSVPGFMEFISATADRLSAHYENSHDEVLRTRINALEKEKSEAEAFFGATSFSHDLPY
ncbi:hypothetical protein DFJ73DRAFT_545095 [Zopfochytrium polystomum]|nr:hypothetical protein DFJ73DRAFT_545095 [Zopfochytrium polystomum]